MTMLRRVDAAVHFLYAPTMLGRRAGRARWHHRIHLIPRRLMARVCDAYETRLLRASPPAPVTLTCPYGCLSVSGASIGRCHCGAELVTQWPSSGVLTPATRGPE